MMVNTADEVPKAKVLLEALLRRACCREWPEVQVNKPFLMKPRSRQEGGGDYVSFGHLKLLFARESDLDIDRALVWVAKTQICASPPRSDVSHVNLRTFQEELTGPNVIQNVVCAQAWLSRRLS